MHQYTVTFKRLNDDAKVELNFKFEDKDIQPGPLGRDPASYAAWLGTQDAIKNRADQLGFYLWGVKARVLEAQEAQEKTSEKASVS